MADLHAGAYKKNVFFFVSNIGIVIELCSFFPLHFYWNSGRHRCGWDDIKL